MRHSTCGPGASWCARTDELFGVEGMHVLHVTRDSDVGGEQGLVVLDVESDADARRPGRDQLALAGGFGSTVEERPESGVASRGVGPLLILWLGRGCPRIRPVVLVDQLRPVRTPIYMV